MGRKRVTVVTNHGTVSWDEDGMAWSASPIVIERWRKEWPCSTLADVMCAAFDKGGLIDVEHVGKDDVDAHELTAIVSSAVREACLPDTHPCSVYFREGR